MTGPSLSGPIALALELAALLDELGIPYVLGGSVASSLVGEPRATMDVDLAVELATPQAERLVAALGSGWYVSRDAALDAVRRHASFNLVHLETMQKVDLFVLGHGLLDRRQLAGRRRVVVDVERGDELWVGSPEDQVLRKLWWYRLGGEVSERQWRDVVAMLTVQGERLDLDDLSGAARALDLAELLARARQDAGLT